MAREVGAELVVLDPAVPLGIVGPWLDLPYVVVLHGAEVTVPGRLPVTSKLLGNVLHKASGVIASGTYPAKEARRCVGRNIDITVVTPGVDVSRFRELSNEQKLSARKQFGIADDAELIVGVSRLVPRKGFDILIRAAAHLANDYPKLRVVIAGHDGVPSLGCPGRAQLTGAADRSTCALSTSADRLRPIARPWRLHAGSSGTGYRARRGAGTAPIGS